MGLRQLRRTLTPWSRPSDDPSLDTIFDILQNERRRYTIHYLKQQDKTVHIRELVEQVAAWENEKSTESVSSKERQRVHVSMVQSHIPSMEEAELIRFDTDTKSVELTERAKGMDIYLEIVPEGDIDWGEYYLGIALFNAVILGLVWIDLYPFSALPQLVWLIFIPGVFLLASILHYWYQQKHQLGSGPVPVVNIPSNGRD